MNRFLAGLSMVLLSACGGGDPTSVVPTPTPTPSVAVTDIQPDRLSYGQKTIFKVTGAGLDQNVSVSVSKCTGLTLVATGTAAEKLVTCTVSGTAALSIEVKDSAGAVLLSKVFTVPEPQVTLTTTMGTLVVELNPTVAPVTVNNYLQYVRDGFYNNTVFHRVIAGFVAQGGWATPAGTVQAGQRAAIVLESNKGLGNVRGSLGMARASAADSATSQFYFNLINNPGLDYASATNPGYAVFGKVVQGLAVMDAIGSVPTTTKYGLPDFPVTDIVVQTAVQSL